MHEETPGLLAPLAGLESRAAAEHPGRAREYSRAPAYGAQAGRLAAHRRLGRASRLPAGIVGTDPFRLRQQTEIQ